MFREFAVHKKFQSYAASFSEDKLCNRRYVGKPQFSSTVGIGNEIKLKSRLSPFSLIRILGLRAFCFGFRNLQPLSKCWYTLTVWLGILAPSKSCFLGRVLSLIRRPSLLSDTVSLRFGFKLIIVLGKSMQISFTDRALPTISRRDKTWGWKSPDSALHWLRTCSAWRRGVRGHGWDDTVDRQLCSCTDFDDTEFASRSSVEWCACHQWTITGSTGVQSFCVRWRSDVAKMRTAPKNAIFTPTFAISATPVTLIFFLSSSPSPPLLHTHPYTHW